MSIETIKKRLYIFFFINGAILSIILIFTPYYLNNILKEKNEILLSLIFALPSAVSFFSNNYWGSLLSLTAKYKEYLVYAFSAYSFLFILFIYIKNSYTFLLILCFSTFFYSMIKPTIRTIITLLEHESSESLSKLLFYESVGWASGAVFGGFIFKISKSNDIFNMKILNSFFVFIAIVALITALYIRFNFHLVLKNSKSEVRSGYLNDLLNNLKIVYNNKKIRNIFLVYSMISFVNGSFFSLFSVYFTNIAKGSTTVLGYGHFFATVFGAVVYLFIHKFKKVKDMERLLFLSLFLYFFYYTMLIQFNSPVIITILFSIPVYPFLNYSVISILKSYSNEKLRATVFGSLDGVRSLAGIFAPVLGGSFSFYFGLKNLPILTSFLTFLCLILSFIIVKPKIFYK